MDKLKYVERPTMEELMEKYKDSVRVHELSEEEIKARRESVVIANEMRRKQKVKDADSKYIF